MRRPVRPNSADIHEALGYLRARGATWAPDVLAIDESGREVLRWMPGERTWVRHRNHWGTERDVARIGRLVRELHDLLAAHVSPVDERLLGLSTPNGPTAMI